MVVEVKHPETNRSANELGRAVRPVVDNMLFEMDLIARSLEQLTGLKDAGEILKNPRWTAQALAVLQPKLFLKFPKQYFLSSKWAEVTDEPKTFAQAVFLEVISELQGQDDRVGVAQSFTARVRGFIYAETEVENAADPNPITTTLAHTLGLYIEAGGELSLPDTLKSIQFMTPAGFEGLDELFGIIFENERVRGFTLKSLAEKLGETARPFVG